MANESAAVVAKVQEIIDLQIFFLIKIIVFSSLYFSLIFYYSFGNFYRISFFLTHIAANTFGLKRKKNGESGYRSQYLPHAKRALYHLS